MPPIGTMTFQSGPEGLSKIKFAGPSRSETVLARADEAGESMDLP
jgi:hypothetical protein